MKLPKWITRRNVGLVALGAALALVGVGFTAIGLDHPQDEIYFAWWHGFYDLKKTYQEFVHLADEAEKAGHGSPVFVPGSGGKNLTPAKVAPLPEGWKDVKHLKGVPADAGK